MESSGSNLSGSSGPANAKVPIETVSGATEEKNEQKRLYHRGLFAHIGFILPGLLHKSQEATKPTKPERKKILQP